MDGLRAAANSAAYGAVLRGCKRAAAAAMLAVAGIGAAAQEVQIAALGDSLTQGFGLPQSAGFVPQLQDWLDGEGVDAEIVNAGVSGDTTAGGLARVDWTLTPQVDAMIVALGGNDLLRAIDPAVSRDNLAGILEAARDRGLPVLLVGLSAPGNYGPEFKRAFDGMYPDLAAEYGAMHYPNFLAPLQAAQDAGFDARARYMQPDGIHPNAQGVTLIVEAMGPAVAALARAAAPEAAP